ncbi:hypothetical protein CRUP_010002 [Coryphaenoides rupestris]|nr:hypothetical protein CRUP_010002 [Coryphaenoides rupestris]
MRSGMRSASDSREGVAEWDAGVPGVEKSGEGDGEGLVRGVRSEELREEKSTTSPFSRSSLTGVEEEEEQLASFWALRISLASWVRERFSFSWMALSTGFLAPRFRRPSTVIVGSRAGLDTRDSKSGRRVGGRFWTSFHQPGSPNSWAPERKKVGLPTDRQPATVLHHRQTLERQTLERQTSACRDRPWRDRPQHVETDPGETDPGETDLSM